MCAGVNWTNWFSLPCACLLSVTSVPHAGDGMFLCRTVCVFCPLHMPFDPCRVRGQFIIWLWCYNTIGLQWCCSSSLTLLAPPTGPLLPTLLLLCLSGFALCSRQAMFGWPMRRWRRWQPLPKRSVSLCPFTPTLLFLCQSCVFESVDPFSGLWTRLGGRPSLIYSSIYVQVTQQTSRMIPFNLASSGPHVSYLSWWSSILSH